MKVSIVFLNFFIYLGTSHERGNCRKIFHLLYYVGVSLHIHLKYCNTTWQKIINIADISFILKPEKHLLESLLYKVKNTDIAIKCCCSDFHHEINHLSHPFMRTTKIKPSKYLSNWVKASFGICDTRILFLTFTCNTMLSSSISPVPNKFFERLQS